MYLAHISDDGTRKQTVLEHCNNVADIAAALLEPVGLSACGRLAGMLHDMGKMTKAFQDYLLYGGKKGSVIHTFQAVRYLLSKYHNDPNEHAYLVAEIIACACGGHHGSFDCVGQNGSGFKHRLDSLNVNYDEALKNFVAEGVTDEILDKLMSEATVEIGLIIEQIYELAGISVENCNNELMFYLGLVVRLVQSALIDADRRDTAEFMNGCPLFAKEIKGASDLWAECLENMQGYVVSLGKNDAISVARSRISSECVANAVLKPGIFRFYAPCGGGKTVASTLFALTHAMNGDGKRNVIKIRT